MTPVISTLSDLVRINSVNPAYAQGRPEANIQAFVAEFFRAHGIETYQQEVFPDRPNVIARLPGRVPGLRLVFEAHCDTAGVAGMTILPFSPEVRGGFLYGRGACDTKAGLAGMMHAIADVKASGRAPAAEIWVVSAADEEHNFRGVVRLRQGLEAAGAVVSEPTDMRLVVATKGCLRWRIVTRGRAAHSSKPHLGVNAIHAMGHVLNALEGENARLAAGPSHPLVGSATFSVGLITGGTQVNAVPDTCAIEVDRRLIPGKTPESTLAAYGAILEELRAEHEGLQVEMEDPNVCDFPLDTPADARIARVTAEALAAAGLDGIPQGVPYGSDASKLAQAGIPSIVLGPGSIDQAHSAVEFVEVAQVEAAVEVYRRIMETFE